MFILSEQTIWINTVSQTVKGSLGVAPNTPKRKENAMREIALVAVGVIAGGFIGVTFMCLFQINKDRHYIITRKDGTENEEKKHSEDC